MAPVLVSVSVSVALSFLSLVSEGKESEGQSDLFSLETILIGLTPSEKISSAIFLVLIQLWV